MPIPLLETISIQVFWESKGLGPVVSFEDGFQQSGNGH